MIQGKGVSRIVTLPVALYLLGHLLFGVLDNAADAFAAPADDKLSAWLQLFANGGMWLLLAFGTAALLQLQTHNKRGQIRSWNAARVLGMLLIFAFTLPSLPLWVRAAWQWFTVGQSHIAFVPFSYLLAALCQPLLLAACVGALWRQWHLIRRLRHARATAFAPDTVYIPPTRTWKPWKLRR